MQHIALSDLTFLSNDLLVVVNGQYLLLLLDDDLFFEFPSLRHLGRVHPIFEAPLDEVETVATPVVQILLNESSLLRERTRSIPPLFERLH